MCRVFSCVVGRGCLHVVVQSLSHVQFFSTLWTTANQALLSSTNCQSLLKFMFIESTMLSNHLILCHPLLLLPSIFPSIRVFSNESALPRRWTKYWRFSLSLNPSSEFQDWFPLGLTGLISCLSKGLSRMLSSTTAWKQQFFGTQLSLWSMSLICELPW